MSETSESPFGARAVAVLLGAGVLLAVGFLLLSGFGQDMERSFGREPPAQSRTGDGLYGLFKLVDDTSEGMASLATEAMDYGTADLLVLTPEAGTDREAIDAILARREAGHATLIVLPKWQVQNIPLRRNRVRATGPVPLGDLYKLVPLEKFNISREASSTLKATGDYPGQPFPPVRKMVQGINADALTTLITDKNGDAVLARIGRSDTFILADPDLIDNQALNSNKGALAALSMMGALNPTAPGLVSFDVTLHYHPGERNLIKLMFTPPFLAVTTALFFAALLAGWASAMRFGPVRREGRAIALGKTALVDNAAALTRLAGKVRLSGDRYADGVRDWAARKLRAPRRLKGDELTAFIDSATGGMTRRFSELEAELRAADSEHDMLHAAQRLNDWQKELTA
ncbi:hypothetical protein [Stakelama marina]|uniref:DUF4350 domain-containing protein n=1 Tax=Stakelama marina TaxID=2826939 RepID=A0A8T4IA53_9SPHN|nr:hypothetical protein [Stakelama marina]MBR0551012.1 hypothetical protein [Stakelama marina]